MKDGSTEFFQSDKLQEKLEISCRAAGLTKTWIAEDIALSVEFSLGELGNDKIFTDSEIDSIVIKVLQEAGLAAVATHYKHQQENPEPEISFNSETITEIVIRYLHVDEKHLEDIIGIADRFDGEILLAGLGPALEHYKKLAAGKKSVKFLGFLDRKDLLGFYSSLDLFVFPSTVETQGLVALEAMACGVPVIGADAFALKNTITPGKTGYLYRQGDKEMLGERIEKGYENRKKLSKNCKEYVKEHSVEKSMEKLMKLYEKLI